MDIFSGPQLIMKQKLVFTSISEVRFTENERKGQTIPPNAIKDNFQYSPHFESKLGNYGQTC